MEKDCNLTKNNPPYIPIDKSRGITAIFDKLALERAETAERFLGLKNIKIFGYGKCCYISKINLKDRRVVIYGMEKF